MEAHSDGSVSPLLQPVRVNWQKPDGLNELDESHVELDLDYDIDKPWSSSTDKTPFEVEGQDVSIADMFLLRSLDPQTSWTAAKASEYFTPLLVDVADVSSPAGDSMPPVFNITHTSSFLDRQPRSKIRRRLGLPLVFVGGNRPTTILTCPDSGSDRNVMAFETAGSLGYPIEHHGDSESTQFILANGDIVNSIGKVSAKCEFTTGVSSTGLVYDCIFFVFRKLAVPIIMGMDFLEETETLSKHRDRLVEEIVPILHNFRVHTVGQQRKGLYMSA